MLCILDIKSAPKGRIAKCLCECGVKKNIFLYSIKPGGKVRSCGCYRKKERARRNTIEKPVEERKCDDRRYKMFHNAQHRAKKKGIPFTISIEDIIIPETCPLLGIPLVSTNNKRDPRNPSLDQKIAGKGYTPDNIWVISSRANALKWDASLQELKTLVENLEKL
jgi:hypothetical protein